MDIEKLTLTIINDLKFQNLEMNLKLEKILYKSFNIKDNKKKINLYYKLLKDLDE